MQMSQMCTDTSFCLALLYTKKKEKDTGSHQLIFLLQQEFPFW